jgi:hypothetical protein
LIRSVNFSLESIAYSSSIEVLTAGYVRDNALVVCVEVEAVLPEVPGRSGIGANDAMLLRQVFLAECLIHDTLSVTTKKRRRKKKKKKKRSLCGLREVTHSLVGGRVVDGLSGKLVCPHINRVVFVDISCDERHVGGVGGVGGVDVTTGLKSVVLVFV